MIDDTTVRENLTVSQVAFFAAQLTVDSDALAFLEEPWSPKHIAHQRLYDNPIFGNTCEADLERYRARGFARLVGRQNYAAFSRWSRIDCVKEPEALTELSISYLSWVWLWKQRDGKRCADLALKDFVRASTAFIGWPDRLTERYVVFQRNLEHMTRSTR